MTRNLTFWLVIALTVVCAGLITFGVLTQKEPGFQNPSVRWSKDAFPLKVSAVSYSGTLDKGPLDHVITTINTRLKFEAFAWARDGEVSDVSVSLGEPYETSWDNSIAQFVLHGNSATKIWTSCTIRTSNTGTDEILFLALEHELGHCLGLAHDDYEQSIMRPVQSETPDGSLPPWISDFDRKILRAAYAP